MRASIRLRMAPEAGIKDGTAIIEIGGGTDGLLRTALAQSRATLGRSYE